MSLGAYDDVAASVRPEPRRDQWGRYLITPAAGGKPVGHTRVTTLAKTLDDTFALGEWGKRVVACGMAARPDLVALAHGARPDEKQRLHEVIKAAEEAGGANERRRLGTALHSMCERVDLGLMTLDDVLPQHQDDVAAYLRAISEAGVEIVPEWVERIVVLPFDGQPAAGTFDRGVRTPEPEPLIADLKTGTSVEFGAASIAIQLAAYANAETMWDPRTDTHEPNPAWNKAKALVIHLPAGEARCAIFEIDIASGWEAMTLVHQVRAFRKRKGWLTKIADGGVEDASGTAPAASFTPVGTLPTTWAEAKPAPPETPDNGAPVDLDETRAKILDLIAANPAMANDSAEMTTFLRWVAEGKSPHQWRTTEKPFERQHCIYRAAVRLAKLVGGADDADDQARELLTSLVEGLEVQPSMRVGMALGALTSAEASYLAGTFEAMLANGIAIDDDGRARAAS